MLCSTLAIAALLLLGCSNTDTPEHRVRALIDSAEQAVEKKEIRQLRGYVSDRYGDEQGRDRRTIDGILRLYLLRHETIHLLTRIERVRMLAQDQAEATVFVAMAGRPLSGADELARFNANLYRFEIALNEEDGQWRVTKAAWRPADPTDFIYKE